jgi:glycosyltransferase involved in cell wall biosynthesis
MISIVIPAYNEGETIANTLAALAAGSLPEELDIIVVCNGCVDNTAEVAHRHGSPVRVIETLTANKANALNIGDRAAGAAFPRFYIDADIAVPLDTIRALAQQLAQGDVLAVAPRARIETSACSRAVRWFYETAALLPSASEGIGGSGMYALSAEGRRRFRDFPDLIADDAFVRIQFNARECVTIQTLTSTVIPPRCLKELVEMRTRVRQGHLEVRRACPQHWRQHWQSNRNAAIGMVGRVPMWPKLLLYACVVAIARIKARHRDRRNIRKWDRGDRIPRRRVKRSG